MSAHEGPVNCPLSVSVSKKREEQSVLPPLHKDPPFWGIIWLIVVDALIWCFLLLSRLYH